MKITSFPDIFFFRLIVCHEERNSFIKIASSAEDIPENTTSGCSEKNVYYLDKGEIRALIVPNEFNIGYLSVAAIAGQLREPLSSAKTEEIGFLTITKENLYDEENQKILFPIVQ